MNGISTDALVGLAGVALGAFISLIGVWIEGRREARRIAEQRRYERAKERINNIEPHIARLHHLSNEVRDAAEGVLRWTLFWAQTSPSKRPQTLHYLLNTLERALEKAEAVREEAPGIIPDSLDPQILDGFDQLRGSFSTLCMLASAFLSDQGIPLTCEDVERTERWGEEWRSEIVNQHETFKGVYKTLVIAIGNVLERGDRRPSWVQRLREWWGRREG